MLCGRRLLGIAEAQAEHQDLEIHPIIFNPGGDNARYFAMASEMLASGIKHVVGCYTSSSRKESFRFSKGGRAALVSVAL